MNIKWNWGTKLAIWIIAFIVFMLSLVYMTTKSDINLVEKDYYPKGQVYQTRINAINNAIDINAVFSTSQDENNIIINLPDIQVDSGSILFFRPSANSLDRTYELIMVDDRRLVFPIDNFEHGKYILKINWFYSNKEYYVEQVFFMK